MSLKGLYFVSL